MAKDKLTLKQAIREVHHAYDFFEEVSRQVLKDEFSFNEEQVNKFEERFSYHAAQECLRIESSLRKRLRR